MARLELIAATVVAAAVVAGASAAGPAAPGEVAFKVLPGGEQAIVLVDQAGREVVDLTDGRPAPSEFGAFSWSPDGSKLVYASAEGDVYVIGPDGGGLTRLTTDGGNDQPAWSPDGTRIAYIHTVKVPQPSGTNDLKQDVWVVGPDGTGARQLTHDGTEKFSLQWSPGGSQLLVNEFTTGETSAGAVVTRSAATGDVLTSTRGYGGVWSPTGSTIAFLGSDGIAVMNSDGSDRRTLGAGAGALGWSPDGTLLAFTRTHCAAALKGICTRMLSAVYVVTVATGSGRRLTGPKSHLPGTTVDGFANDESVFLGWWPDGSRLFVARENHAYTINADGTCATPFGPPTLLLAQPAWRPGTSATAAPTRCVDLRLLASPTSARIRGRSRLQVQLTLENDGNLTATGLRVRLRVVGAPGRIAVRGLRCRGVAIVECSLPPLAAGAARDVYLTAANAVRRSFQLRASAAARQGDSDPADNATVVYVSAA